MKPDAMMVRVKALRVARLGGMRSPEQVDILGEQIAAAITTALSERDAEWQERLEDAEALAADLRQRLDGQRAGHCKTIESRDEWWRKCQQAERQRDEALGLVARLRWAVREYADTALLDDAEEGRCDCDAETEQCEFCGLREALAAHPEPAEQAATDEERGRDWPRCTRCGVEQNQHAGEVKACWEFTADPRPALEPPCFATPTEEPKP